MYDLCYMLLRQSVLHTSEYNLFSTPLVAIAYNFIPSPIGLW